MEALFFWLFALTAFVGGCVVVASRNAMTCALALAATFLSLGALFVTLGAFFLAVAQVMIYAGAVMALFLFVVMLVNNDEERAKKISWSSVITAAALAMGFAALFFLVFGLIKKAAAPLFFQNAENIFSVKALATLLFKGYMLPFLTTALILLTAIVGVVFLAGKDES
ncbi:MAG: NADH-quinone oxidoreductase subunit J [bacterium]